MRGPVFIGYDSRAPRAYEVAARSMDFCSGSPASAQPLDSRELRKRRLLWRPTEDHDGQLYDVLSDAPQSTEFAISRFLVPFLFPRGWSLFVDQDVVFLDDVGKLFALRDESKAIMCVQHESFPYTAGTKMQGQAQVNYPRKGWSSVVLWNALHPAHLRLSLGMVNHYPGDLLHRFFWLRDSEIGALPPEWNWLVNVQAKPPQPKLAHFTLGGPWIPGWKELPHDEIWKDAANL